MLVAMNLQNCMALKKAFTETESMMDALIDRVMAKDGIWFKTELTERYKEKVAIGELRSR